MPKIEKVEKYLEEYSSIILFDDRNEDINRCEHAFFANGSVLCADTKIMVMGMKNDVDVDERVYKVIPEQEYNLILWLYRMYEFTDKLRIVSGFSQFGSMLNYLSTGIITQEEYFEALLH